MYKNTSLWHHEFSFSFPEEWGKPLFETTPPPEDWNNGWVPGPVDQNEYRIFFPLVGKAFLIKRTIHHVEGPFKGLTANYSYTMEGCSSEGIYWNENAPRMAGAYEPHEDTERPRYQVLGAV